MMLQSKSFSTLYDQLSQESQHEVFSDILKTKTLMDVLKHPVIANGFKSELLERHDYNNTTFLRHIISTTDNVELLYHLYLGFTYKDSYDQIISDYIVKHCWKRCIKLPGDKILLLDEWLYARDHFNLDSYPIHAEFNFQRDIIDRNIQDSSICILQCENTIPNVEWNAHSPPGTPQCIPVGQKEVTICKLII
jgi:hypothetical protein